VVETAKFLSGLHEISLEEMAIKTSGNFRTLFRLSR